MSERIDDALFFVEVDLALRVSAILCNTPRTKQLDALMDMFKPYLNELAAHQRRSKIRRVK